MNYVLFSLPARTVQTKFDASTLHDNPQLARETGMVDDGSGEKKVRIFIHFYLYQGFASQGK